MQTGPRSAAPPSKPEPRQPRADHHIKQAKHQPWSKKVSEAKERVVELERSLAAMEEIDGSEVDTIREALERAKKAAQTPPVETQIRDCEQFLVRARALLEAIDVQRATVVASVEEGSKWLESLKVLQQNQPPPVPNMLSEVQRLQALVAQLQSQFVQVAGRTPMTVDIPSSKRARLREDFVPSCVEEMQQWVWDRQQDLQAATMVGRPEEVGRISQLIIEGAQEWHGVQAEQTTVGSGSCTLPSTVGLMVR